MPTLEIHRHLSFTTQVKQLFATDLIDIVIIGNAYASDEGLENMAAVNRAQVEFKFEYIAEATPLEKSILEQGQHSRRGDITDWMIRSTQVRVKYANEDNLAKNNIQEFQRGDIVLGNDDFGKYKNELQIVLKPHKDPRKNLVGRIEESEILLLEYIRPWSKFRLKKQE